MFREYYKYFKIFQSPLKYARSYFYTKYSINIYPLCKHEILSNIYKFLYFYKFKHLFIKILLVFAYG